MGSHPFPPSLPPWHGDSQICLHSPAFTCGADLGLLRGVGVSGQAWGTRVKDSAMEENTLDSFDHFFFTGRDPAPLREPGPRGHTPSSGLGLKHMESALLSSAEVQRMVEQGMTERARSTSYGSYAEQWAAAGPSLSHAKVGKWPGAGEAPLWVKRAGSLGKGSPHSDPQPPKLGQPGAFPTHVLYLNGHRKRFSVSAWEPVPRGVFTK